MSSSERALALCFALITGCSGAAPAPSAPAPPPEPGWLDGTTAAQPNALDGTTWRLAEAFCTEGVLGLGVGYEEILRVGAEGPRGILVSERRYRAERCAQTVVYEARRGNPRDPDHRWSIREQARVSFPTPRLCAGAPQPDANGDLRMRGEALEVFIQRSPRCGGYEARLVYERATTAAPRDPEALLHAFVAHFHRRDAERLAALYGPTGRHVDPHRPGEDGAPSHHVGAEAVRAYFSGVFHHVPWVAMRLVDQHVTGGDGDTDGSVHIAARVEYMEPRLDAPRGASLHLLVGGGVIVESRLELDVESN